MKALCSGKQAGQRKTNAAWCHLHTESKREVKLTEAESSAMAARGWEGLEGEADKWFLPFRVVRSGDLMYSVVAIVGNIEMYN